MIGSVEETIFLPPQYRSSVRNLFAQHHGIVQAREDPHCEYSYVIAGEDGRLVVRQYTNGKLQMQGSAEDLHRTFSLQIKEMLGEAGVEDPLEEAAPTSLLPFPHGGSDETGKGDYFGPLVVAAVYMTAEQAREAARQGVADSKGISDGRSLKIAQYLRSEFAGQWSRVVLDPPTYNRVYTSLKGRGQNLNDLLARCHARCIIQLKDQLGNRAAPLKMLVDKFARDDLLLSYLCDSADLEVTQVEQAERDPAVAAASILARAEFLQALKRLSEETGTVLPKGAGDLTVAAGKAIVRSHGRQSLFRVAKLHFANTDKIGPGG